jgi:hypothetical protein
MAFSVKLGTVIGVIVIQLHAGEHLKIRLRHSGMIGNGVVIGDTKNLIPQLLVHLLHFHRESLPSEMVMWVCRLVFKYLGTGGNRCLILLVGIALSC